jgi:ketosteroid isomerase-like protein
MNSGIFVLILFLIMGTQSYSSAQPAVNASEDQAAIRALEDRFVVAFNAGDIDAIMKNYVPGKSLVIFDVVPRKGYHGAEAYREDWVDFFSHFNGTPKIAITDLGITTGGDAGFGHSLQHVTGTDKQGHPVDRWVRVTDGYRKIGGKWLIALEHVSVPVDPVTGRGIPKKYGE